MTQKRRVSGRATTIVRHDRDGRTGIGVLYHQTIVAFKTGEGVVRLRTGGWPTVTTKLRMNQFANEYCDAAFTVYQTRGEWFVHLRKPGINIPFVEDMEVPV